MVAFLTDIRLVFARHLATSKSILNVVTISERRFYDLAIFIFSEIVIIMINW